MIITGRQNGKTTQAMEWMLAGMRCPGYPGWTRVLLVHSEPARAQLRSKYWGDVLDIDHRLYTYDEWTGMRKRGGGGVSTLTEVMIDELEMSLDLSLRIPGKLVGFTTSLE